jgi:adenosylcobinamide-GDP ribazoletransferase
MTALPGPVRDIALCVTFFTRLPLPSFDMEGRSLAAALWAAPVAGWVVGVAGWLVATVAMALGLPPGAAAAVAIAATMAVSGALHEDGLADVADGFGGGRDRDRKLEIMRDSRVGSYGACALALSILIRWTALAAVLPSPHVLAAFLAAHGASRALLPSFMASLPSARQSGLAAGAGASNEATVGAALALGLLSLLGLGTGGALAAVLVLALLFVLFRALCRRQIGGYTGDTLGALQQAAEVAILLCASALLT